jgi:hypothetical protein
MTSFIAILLFAATMLGGGILTFVCLHVFVPLIVRAVGEEKFVEMSGLEPCSIILFSGFAGGVLYAFLAQKWGAVPALLLFPALSLLCVMYAVLWLKLAAAGQGKNEFEIRDERIVRLQDEQVLAPTYVRRDIDFNQTDAFHSYNFYHLTVCDENGKLARNIYHNEDEAAQVLHRVLECGKDVPCRALDITFVRRDSDTLWWQVQLDQEQASLLCGGLGLISGESRSWWRQWLRPQFSEDGFAEVPAAEVEKHYAELKRAYGASMIPQDDVPYTSPEDLEAQMAALDRKKDWDQLVQLSEEYGKAGRNKWICLEMLLRRTNQPVQIMTAQRFEAEARQVAPEGATLCYGEANGHTSVLGMEIQPR